MTLSFRSRSRPSALLVRTSSLRVEKVTSKSSTRFDVQERKQNPSLYLPGGSTSRRNPPPVGSKYRPRCPGSTVVAAHPLVLAAAATSAAQVIAIFFMVSPFQGSIIPIREEADRASRLPRAIPPGRAPRASCIDRRWALLVRPIPARPRDTRVVFVRGRRCRCASGAWLVRRAPPPRDLQARDRRR